MPSEPIAECLSCEFQQSEQGEWDNVEDPTLGELTACPKCGSTDIISGREIT
jgi:Zn finger protein HypA/HybF involved in hydrogenase expression